MKTSQNHICKSVWNTICISFLGPCHQHAILDSSALHHLRTIGPLCPHLSSGKSSSSINSRESRRTCNWTSPTSNVLCFLYLCVISISIYSLVLSFIENLCFFFSSLVLFVIFLFFVCQSPPLFCSLPSCISYSSRIDISDHELHLFIAKKHNYMLLKELLLGKHKYFYW